MPLQYAIALWHPIQRKKQRLQEKNTPLAHPNPPTFGTEIKILPMIHDLKSLVDTFNQYIDNNMFAEALNFFYRDDMISVDNDAAPIRGRQEMLELTSAFLESTRNFSTRVINTLVSDHISVVERVYSFDMPEGGHYHFKQVSIQQWADAKIWHERHIYSL